MPLEPFAPLDDQHLPPMLRHLYTVTLNWNRRADTLACLTSLVAVRWPDGWQVCPLLVDNGSTDDTVEAVRARFPEVEILALGRNFGFAGGANRGLRHALGQGAEAIFLANNDTWFDPTLGESLLGALENDVAAVSPAIFYAEEPDRVWSLGGTRSRLTLEMTDQHGRTLRSLPTHPFDRDLLTGCGILFQSRALRQIGLFDEQFFMYYEDNDWSLRARRAGWRLRVAPAARMWHKEARSSGGLGSPAERYQMGRASAKFFRKVVRGPQWLFVGPWRLAYALKSTLRMAGRGQGAAIRSYWRGLWHGLREPVHRAGWNCAP